MNKLFLHIGTWKTGSSTIQYNLHGLRKKLEREGFFYLSKENKMVIDDGIIRNFTEIDDDYVQKSREKFKAILDQKRKENPQLSFISSAEEYSGDPFMGFKNAGAVAKNLYEITKELDLDISIIVYLRRQDDFFESLYQQSIRLGYSHDFDEFCGKYDATDFNWYDLLKSYSDLFGNDNMIVRRYHRTYLPEENSLIQDFGKAIGSEIVSNFEETRSRNKGFSRDTLEITKIMNKYFEGEERFKLRKIYDQVNAKMPFEKYAFFSPEERKEFLKQYEESNHMVAKKYFDEEKLFPDPEFNPEQESYSGLTKEAMVANFSKALLLVKEEADREKEQLARNLQNHSLLYRLRRTVSKGLDRFPKMKKSLKGWIK